MVQFTFKKKNLYLNHTYWDSNVDFNCKLRTCNTKFPIETGRWQRVKKNRKDL
jgi:hypothetical protein